MTTNQPDRIDRIEALLENFIAASVADRASNSELMKATNERIAHLEQMSEKTDARFNQLIAEADANREVTFMMLEQMTSAQEHITTLQEESKRILDYLFGQQRNGNGNQPQQ